MYTCSSVISSNTVVYVLQELWFDNNLRYWLADRIVSPSQGLHGTPLIGEGRQEALIKRYNLWWRKFHVIGRNTYRLNWTAKTSSVTRWTCQLWAKRRTNITPHLHKCEAIFYAETTDHTTLVPLTVSRIAQDFVRRNRTDQLMMEELSLVKTRHPHWLKLRQTVAIGSSSFCLYDEEQACPTEL